MPTSVWIPITLVAAFLQNVRSYLQQRLTKDLSINAAAYVRFFYALPWAWVYVAFLDVELQRGLAEASFWGYCLTGGVSQILATSCLIASFAGGNFAVGTGLSKTEAAQAALFGLLLLGDTVSWTVCLGIAISFVGVLQLSGRVDIARLRGASLWYGLAAGAGFAVSAVSFRGASLVVMQTGSDTSVLQSAGLTLALTLSLQTLLLGLYLYLREPGSLTRVIRSWRPAVWIGATGMLASAGWFTAMTLVNAALVRALGQVELLFTLATSMWLLREKVSAREVSGVVFVVGGLLLLLSA